MIIIHILGAAAALGISASKIATLVQDIRDREALKLWAPGACVLILLQALAQYAIWHH